MPIDKETIKQMRSYLDFLEAQSQEIDKTLQVEETTVPDEEVKEADSNEKELKYWYGSNQD